jgi:hypothetical protein
MMMIKVKSTVPSPYVSSKDISVDELHNNIDFSTSYRVPKI